MLQRDASTHICPVCSEPYFPTSPFASSLSPGTPHGPFVSISLVKSRESTSFIITFSLLNRTEWRQTPWNFTVVLVIVMNEPSHCGLCFKLPWIQTLISMAGKQRGKCLCVMELFTVLHKMSSWRRMFLMDTDVTPTLLLNPYCSWN